MASVTATGLAAHLSCTRETVSDYVAAGVIEKLRDGRFDQDACRAKVLRHLRARAAGRSGSGGADLSHERALLAKEQRESAVIKNSLARGELVLVRDVRRIVENEYGTIREGVLAMPGGHSDALADAARNAVSLADATSTVEAMLRDAIHEALDGLSNGEKVAAEAAEMGKQRR